MSGRHELLGKFLTLAGAFLLIGGPCFTVGGRLTFYAGIAFIIAGVVLTRPWAGKEEGKRPDRDGPLG